MSTSTTAKWVIVLGALLVATSCRPPRVAPLQGAPVPAQQLPTGTLPGGTRQVVFRWELKDGDMLARGDGVARIASPDSVRLDFFLGGGFGGGAAVLIGDSLQVPGPDAARKLVPPRALLWAALGRLDIPAEPDTIVRVDAGVLRADIGAPVRWRATFHGDTLTRLERVDGGRLQEWVERAADRSVQYRNEAARRTLSLVIQRSDAVPPFDPAIWRLQ
ncbi:MAG: hypothetical protein HOQ17_15540 [Gemmatimonadaceae bacterium]|nr:hypothetical protein [Gemmatimonadaceae bacterium]NUO93773.1 hypothetical protein [Gemmatimonadaceae bacterium]NUP72389.1 hypothetical protein [Gemmatimonadaceae bacterium]NUS34461.1 hypothetical protein [Gemmatimonadaceae bacterium]NUS47898.1 hypothetical protein [Gemmatimonadaceae bacterium]